ncbi:hypothetical protein I7I48_10658 [Histoplasma ohiense]|nr:hypothetical protein I7I48_10658 [Histoplasma ohiense (nom. inval.)]
MAKYCLVACEARVVECESEMENLAVVLLSAGDAEVGEGVMMRIGRKQALKVGVKKVGLKAYLVHDGKRLGAL